MVQASDVEPTSPAPGDGARSVTGAASIPAPTFDQAGSSRPTDELLLALRRAERTVWRLRRRQEQLTIRLNDARAAVAGWQQRCEAIEGSRSWWLAEKITGVVGRLLPAGSLRRNAGTRILRALRAGMTPSAAVPTPLPVIPMALEPEVSIIIPVHNHWMLTADCLRSIADDSAGVGFEVIVVDDASTDDTPHRLNEAVGIVPIHLSSNQGFVRAVNAGIDAARGRYLVLLNNDTVVRPGWLDALVETVEQAEDVGVVGAKLLYPDGRLQEAGGVIWRDGSGHNFGRDQDPNDPAYNFVREVDYCSGACLLVRRDLIRLLGGLDERFSPAYYEDTDLCFAARERGYRVLYQPGAVVVHREGASNGTDLASGVKQHQVQNQTVFCEKWAGTLDAQGTPQERPPRVASWRRPRGRILVIDHQIPMPDHDSGSRRMFGLVRLLGDLGFGVTFTPQNGIVIPKYRDALADLGVEVLGGPGDLDSYLAEVGTAVRLVVMSRPTVAWMNLPMIRSLLPGVKVVFDTVDLHFVRERRRVAFDMTKSAEASAGYHHDMEVTLAGLTDQTWVVSEDDAEALRSEVPGVDVVVMPNVHPDEPSGPAFGKREGLLFVGSYSHLPNQDAAEFLVREILPLVEKSLPGVVLQIAGSRLTENVRALEGDKVRVLGWVDDLAEVYARSRLFVAPLRFGAGMKGKIGESLAFGLPVVTTATGVEGMGLTHGRDVLVGQDAAELASLVVEAYTSQELWTWLSENGRYRISEQFSPDRVVTRLSAVLAGLGVLDESTPATAGPGS